MSRPRSWQGVPRPRPATWFRTPPGIRVGREPFDEPARRQIEAQSPGISFDWNAIASTPMPPVPEVEHWRERRRVERAAKVARREEEQETERVDGPTEAPAALTVAEPVALEVAAETTAITADHSVPAEGAAVAAATPAQDAEGQPRKRRRRRGGRRRRTGGEAGSGSEEPGSGSETDSEAEEGLSVAVADGTAGGGPELSPVVPAEDSRPGESPPPTASVELPPPSAPAGRGTGSSEE